MICEVCGQDKPLTYHNFDLKLHSICGPCIRERYPLTVAEQAAERVRAVGAKTYEDIERGVGAAVDWLKKHPHRDYIDAAYMVAASTKRTEYGLATSRWPEFVQAVKIAVHGESIQL